MKLLHEHPFDDTEKLLKTGIFVSFLIFLLELSGGIWSHFLALLSDAWHIFIDIWALVISLLAIFLARRPANDRRTYVLHRVEVMTLRGASLAVLVFVLGVFASRRCHSLHRRQTHGHQ